jgi:hypothetical protein
VIGGELRTMAMHELRDTARLGIAYAQASTPVTIFQYREPSAVIVRLTRSNAGRRSSGRCPPLTVSTCTRSSPTTRARSGRFSQAGTGRAEPPSRQLGRQRREILEIPDTIGITEIVSVQDSHLCPIPG